MRKIVSLLLVLLFIISATFAQTRTVTGRVVDSSGKGVEGASVIIKGTTTGTAADAQGNFRITAKTGDVLVVSSVNYAAQEVTLTAENLLVDVMLTRQVATIDEVVVTALGIRRNRNT